MGRAATVLQPRSSSSSQQAAGSGQRAAYIWRSSVRRYISDSPWSDTTRKDRFLYCGGTTAHVCEDYNIKNHYRKKK